MKLFKSIKFPPVKRIKQEWKRDKNGYPMWIERHETDFSVNDFVFILYKNKFGLFRIKQFLVEEMFGKGQILVEIDL